MGNLARLRRINWVPIRFSFLLSGGFKLQFAGAPGFLGKEWGKVFKKLLNCCFNLNEP